MARWIVARPLWTGMMTETFGDGMDAITILLVAYLNCSRWNTLGAVSPATDSEYEYDENTHSEPRPYVQTGISSLMMSAAEGAFRSRTETERPGLRVWGIDRAAGSRS